MEHSLNRRNALGRWYDRHLAPILPAERLLGALSCLLLNCSIYWVTQRLAAGRMLTDMTTPLDNAIPVIPGWSFIYVACFLFWGVGYVLMARGDRWYRLMTADIAAKLVCGAFFLVLPTTNVRPVLDGGGISNWLLGMIYRSDPALDLFPSIHCLESWLCFRGVLGDSRIPKWYQWFSGIFAILVCWSTLFTKQHVIADVVAGVALAEGMVQLAKGFHWGSRARRLMTWADRKLLG